MKIELGVAHLCTVMGLKVIIFYKNFCVCMSNFVLQ